MIERLKIPAVALLLCGCGGSGIHETLISQPGVLLVTDPQLPGGSYYDTWTFVPTKSDLAVFRMTSNSLTSRIILKDDHGQTIGTATADGTDSDDGFDGEASMAKQVIGGETYTVTTTDAIANETGAYVIWWPDWVQLTIPGD